jgi:hypothetical protein
MSLAAILTQVKTILEGVSGIGNVHKYQRWSKDWAGFLTLYQDDNDKINGWCVTRSQIARRQVTTGEIEVAHILTVRGYYGLKDADASEAVFQGLVDGAIAAFDTYETLNGTCETTHPEWGPMAGMVGLQADIIDLRQFGNVLCHFFEGRLCAEEVKAI